MYILGGMNDQNYVSYDPHILQYDSSKAQQLKHENKRRRKEKQRIEFIKRKLEKMKTGKSSMKRKALLQSLNTEFSGRRNGLEETVSDHFNSSDDEKEHRSPIPEERMKIIRIKTEPDFMSFQPLPDPFHQIMNSSRKYHF